MLELVDAAQSLEAVVPLGLPIYHPHLVVGCYTVSGQRTELIWLSAESQTRHLHLLTGLSYIYNFNELPKFLPAWELTHLNLNLIRISVNSLTCFSA